MTPPRSSADIQQQIYDVNERLDKVLDEATECMSDARESAMKANRAQEMTLKTAERVQDMMVRFESAMSAQTERLRQGAENFDRHEQWMKEKTKECKEHQLQTARLQEQFIGAKQWTPTAVASVVAAAVAAGATWILRGGH